LEIGCGGGRNLLAIKQQFKNKVVLFGTDISQTALNYAKNLKIGKFQVSDSAKIPLKEKFDFILMIDLLEHLKTKKDAIETLDNVYKYLNNSQSYLYLSVPIELNTFSLTWFCHQFPYLKDLTKMFYGHTLQFKINDILKLINKNYFKIDKIFYSVHFISQIQALLFYFIPKTLMRLSLGEKITEDLRDSNEIINNKKHPLLSLIKKVFVRLGHSLSWLAFKESNLRKNSSFAAENMHLLLERVKSL